MNGSKLTHASSLVLVCLLLLPAVSALAAPTEPTPEPAFRDLRTDYVKTWYIYNDSNTNGILDPGDTKIACFDNWWTPVSAHTEHNYALGPHDSTGFYYTPGEDVSSGPMNFADHVNPANNFWLQQEAGTVSFYMAYSQYDNNDFAAMTVTNTEEALVKARNMYRNGWALGYLTNAIQKDASGNVINNQTPAGTVDMDIYVHNGQGTLTNVDFGADGIGTSRSNPNVSMSNDIDALAFHNTQAHPPTFDEATQTYKTDSTVNTDYKTVVGLTDPQFAQIVNSLEVREYDPYDIENQTTVIDAGKTPTQILATLTDHAGNPYAYDDAFTNRATYAVSTNDGGVIAGLLGQAGVNPSINWGDQQVVRIDFDSDTFLSGDATKGNITKVVFWDFGYDPASGQITPIPIILDLANLALFPDNRFYIAQVEIIPEPTGVTILLAGAAALLARRRREKAAR